MSSSESRRNESVEVPPLPPEERVPTLVGLKESVQVPPLPPEERVPTLVGHRVDSAPSAESTQRVPRPPPLQLRTLPWRRIAMAGAVLLGLLAGTLMTVIPAGGLRAWWQQIAGSRGQDKGRPEIVPSTGGSPLPETRSLLPAPPPPLPAPPPPLPAARNDDKTDDATGDKNDDTTGAANDDTTGNALLEAPDNPPFDEDAPAVRPAPPSPRPKARALGTSKPAGYRKRVSRAPARVLEEVPVEVELY